MPMRWMCYSPSGYSNGNIQRSMEQQRQKSALELVRAYVSYKEQRQNNPVRETQSETLASSTVVHPSDENDPPRIYTKLPAALQIRRRSSSAEDVRREAVTPPPSRDLFRVKRSLLETPVINEFTKSTRELARQVSRLNQQLLGEEEPVRGDAVGKQSASSNTSSRQRPDLISVSTSRKLSDVAEEEELLESYRSIHSRRAARKSNPKSESPSMSSETDNEYPRTTQSVDGSATWRILGNGKLNKNLDKVQRLQEMNKTLVRHLKKTMAAYRELATHSDANEKSYVSRINGLTLALDDKEKNIGRLQSQTSFLTHRVQSSNQSSSDEIGRTQVLEVKLAKALSKITKLTKENDDLRSKTSRSSATVNGTPDKEMETKIRELENEVRELREKERLVEELSARLEAKDAKIKLLSQRGSSMVKELYSSDAEKVNSDHTIAVQEEDLKKTRARIAVLDASVESITSEMRETRHELEDKSWKLERLQKDVERLSKEKERSSEKYRELEVEMDDKRRSEKVEWDKKSEAMEEQILRYRSQLKEAEKALARAKVQQEEFGIQYRDLERASQTKMDALSAENSRYMDQLQQITIELTSLDSVNLNGP